ncbi:MAG: SRPBCC family protein [Aggregatilineales bacterium]
MWSISATARTAATIDQVWKTYCDVANWSQWDKGLAYYRPDGPFTTGTNGMLQPVGGPDLPFTLIHVEEGHMFVDRTPIGPDAAIIGRHELVALPDGTQITHTVEIEASDAEGVAQEMGFQQAELQDTVSNLARYAQEYDHE